MEHRGPWWDSLRNTEENTNKLQLLIVGQVIKWARRERVVTTGGFWNGWRYWRRYLAQKLNAELKASLDDFLVRGDDDDENKQGHEKTDYTWRKDLKRGTREYFACRKSSF